jgi:uncharacterized protein (DUF927 family)
LLCLDELSQLNGREAGEVAYMLANGSGKSRAMRDASLRKPAKWRLLFLSSGEIGLADKVAEDVRGRRLTAGQQVRIVDLPADTGSSYGLFEELHGFADAGSLAKHLMSASHANYGHAGREFVTRIAPRVDEVTNEVKDFVSEFLDNDVPSGADGQVRRVAGRFALVAAAGEKAAELGVLPWEAGEAAAAAKICFCAWLEARGGVEPAEVRDGIAAVRSFISAHGSSRFLPAWEPGADQIRIQNLAGFRRTTDDGIEYFVPIEAWSEMAPGFDKQALIKALADRNLLLLPKSGPHRAESIRIPGHGRRRCYHFSANLLGVHRGGPPRRPRRMTDLRAANERKRIAELALKYGMPSVSFNAEMADAGILLSYGASFLVQFRRVAVYVHKILKGAKPADLPIEQPVQLELIINSKTAKALALNIAPSLFARADRVIE